MNKRKLLPRLAFKGITQNATVYFPYLIACIFSVFTFFVFSSIVKNDIVKTLPHSVYAWALLSIGKVLLCIILFPFLFYANSFLLKRRKKEIGLYSLLGLEKKHIGIMLLLETVILYLISLVGGVLFGMVLAKLLFLLLLKLSGLPVIASFVFSPDALKEAMIFFGVVFFINFLYSLNQLRKSRPVELLSGSKKGEKEPKWIPFYAILGAISLVAGYKIAISSRLNTEIFLDFFLAVFLVVIGTYLLFTSGSIVILRFLKGKKGIYYHPSGFITISGMLYRMKKNAASLSNICIFSTMVLITLTCTLALFCGKEDIAYYDYPYDAKVYYETGKLNQEKINDKIDNLCEKYSLEIERQDTYNAFCVSCGKMADSNRFEKKFGKEVQGSNYRVILLTLADYNRLTNESLSLSDQEIVLYSSGKTMGYSTIDFFGITGKVVKEADNLFPWPKAEKNVFQTDYVIVLKDELIKEQYITAFGKICGVEDMESFIRSGNDVMGVRFLGERDNKDMAQEELFTYVQTLPGYTQHENGLTERDRIIAMEGGLLFIGIIFGLVFFMCLLLVMYYKQISEGYEDQGSFSIMQKVGLSNVEIKSTVHKQILMVFFIPLAASLLHTAAGMFMVDALMGALRFFNTPMIIECCIGVSVFFLVVYGISYIMTAKTYYRIVK